MIQASIRRLRPSVALCGAVAVYVAILTHSAFVHSPTFNEAGHLPAGISHLSFGRFELYKVNPPLARLAPAAIALLFRPELNWENYELHPWRDEQVRMAVRFARANGKRTFKLYSFARLGCIPFCVVGAVTCYAWAKELWGLLAGWCAMLLWCTCPLILGHGPLIMPDVPAAASGVFAAYRFHFWLQKLNWPAATIAGFTLGIAQLCKMTNLALIPLWLAIGILLQIQTVAPARVQWRAKVSLQLIWIMAVGLYVLNCGYGFRGSLKPLHHFRFRSELLANVWPGSEAGVIRQQIGMVPVPIPADYVHGLDFQLFEFDVGDRSYLRGEWKARGWWHYQLYGLLVKTPIGMLLLLIGSLMNWIFLFSRNRSLRNGTIVLASHAVVLCVLLSTTHGFSNHIRYSIPVIPFLILIMSSLAYSSDFRVRGFCVICTALACIESVSVYPHSISFFNMLVGGPKAGHNHLLDSNIAWGQDLLYLQQWYDSHPEARPLRAALFGLVDPRLCGIDFELPPAGPRVIGISQGKRASEEGPEPGWYAIDANYLHGTHFPAADGRGERRTISPEGPNYEYFLQLKPTATVGYSTYIYHLSHADANRLRREMGIPLL